MQTKNTEPRSAWAARVKNLQSLEGYHFDPEASFNRIMARVNTGTSPRKRNNSRMMAAALIALLGMSLLLLVKMNGSKKADHYVHTPMQKAPVSNKEESHRQQGGITAHDSSAVAQSYQQKQIQVKVPDTLTAKRPLIVVPDRVAVAVMSPEPETPGDTVSLSMHDPLPVMHANQLRNQAGAEEATQLLKNPFYKIMQGPRPQQAAAPMLSDRNMLQTKTTDN